MFKNKYTFIGIVLITIGVIITMSSYAAFTSSITGTASVVFAKWDFKIDGEKMSFTTDLGNLYPGIDRSFKLSLSAINSEIPVDYTILFNYPNNIPNNLKFYSDEGKTDEINLNGDTLTGFLAAGTSEDVTIYYDWLYGSAAEEYVPGTAWFNMTIFGYQRDPSGGT